MGAFGRGPPTTHECHLGGELDPTSADDESVVIAISFGASLGGMNEVPFLPFDIVQCFRFHFIFCSKNEIS